MSSGTVWGSAAQTFVNLFALIARRMSALLLTSLAGSLNVLFLPAIKYNPVATARGSDRAFLPAIKYNPVATARGSDRAFLRAIKYNPVA
ncbi:MAG TPA: hypothetical protein VES69_10125, partial [Pyrinomonadaceae bacterium]|nr:hypothetical protein [Pyrinomonadaceae bacterium]